MSAARLRLLLGSASVAATAGGLGVAALGGHGAAPFVGAVLGAVVAAGALWQAWILLDLRAQQRHIAAQLDLQAQLLQHAARLAREQAAQEETGPPVSGG